ncbi:3548_t:CDS:2, partial [Dentiscutata heterogama]
ENENESNITISTSQQFSDKKRCSCCGVNKKKEDFYRSDDPNENATCNRCYERRKNKRKETNSISKKKAKMKASTDITPSSSSSASTSQINSSIEEIELFPEQENTLKDNKDENFGSKDYGNDDSPLYSLDEVQEIIAKKFYEAESRFYFEPSVQMQ